MKPRNKHEHLVAGLSEKLKPLTDKHIEYGKEKCFTYHGVLSRKTLSCLECGHSEKTTTPLWQNQVIKHTCKGCNRKLEIRKHVPGAYQDDGYLATFQIVKGFQVIRILHVRRMCFRLKSAEYSTKEVLQYWINEKGRFTLLSTGISSSHYYNMNWGYGELSIKDAHHGYFFNVNAIYPKKQILPLIKRNGFNNDCHGIHFVDLFRELLSSTISETLFKSGQYKMLKYKIENRKKIDDYWGAIKICIRNNYIVHSPRDWVDYLDLLIYFNKDITNPKYVCPEDLHTEHNRYVRKRREVQKKIDLEERKRKMAEEEQEFQKEKGKFLKLHFTDGKIVIEPLKSVQEFVEEGDLFKHCVYTNSYYSKPESLILSAKVNDQKVETIEVNLKTMQIEQSRGLGNKVTKHNKAIKQLLRANIPKIKKIATLKSKVSRKKIEHGEH